MNFIIKTLAALAVILRNVQSQSENATLTQRRVLTTLEGEAGQAASSLCFLPGGEIIPGPVDCPGGEAQLLGQYVNFGVNQAGSFGTFASLDATYYTHTTSLGLLADYDRNGFATSSPGYSGDYFQGGGPVEGKYDLVNMLLFLLISLNLSSQVGCFNTRLRRTRRSTL